MIVGKVEGLASVVGKYATYNAGLKVLFFLRQLSQTNGCKYPTPGREAI